MSEKLLMGITEIISPTEDRGRHQMTNLAFGQVSKGLLYHNISVPKLLICKSENSEGLKYFVVSG